MRIETSTRCSCGTFVVLSDNDCRIRGGFEAMCPSCYGPVEDSTDREKVLGWGKTPDAALWDWQERHDEAWGVEFVPADMFGELARQVSEERERQRGMAGVLRTHEGQVKSRNMEDLLNCSKHFGAVIEYGPEVA